MGLDGPAQVVAIEPCPEIEPDDGTGRNVVTGTMAHPGDNILYLDITGLDESLGVTDTHPIWSETRQDFVVAGQLEVGEQFRTLTGESATLTKIHPHRGPPEMVFNLEVDGQHVYSVAGNGLLVHNTCVPHGYGIIRKSDGEIMKFGVSRAKSSLQKSGLSNRAQAQLSKIAKKFGGARDNYETVLLRTFKDEADMFQWEHEVVGIWRDLKHRLPAQDLPIGKNPFLP